MNNYNNIRPLLLEVIAEIDKKFTAGSMQSGTILDETQQRLRESIPIGTSIPKEIEEATLTCFYDLFRNGILSWGYNFSSPEPPFCHLTEQGRKALEHLSRDPSNPEGYLAFLKDKSDLNPIAESYIKEAIHTYNTNCYKACAVMIGAATESLILTIKEIIILKMNELNKEIPKKLNTWIIKNVIDEIEEILKQKKNEIPKKLFEAFESYWPAFTHQIRTVRNESGHPSSIDPVTQNTVHASLLIFPELANLVKKLRDWINNSFR